MTPRAMGRILTLAALAVMGCSGCARTVTQDAPAPCEAERRMVTAAFLAAHGGVTVCYCDAPYAVISTRLTGIDEQVVRVHEAVHEQQVREVGSCARFDSVYRSGKGRLAWEAAAYHAGWCVEVRAGRDSAATRTRQIEALAAAMGGSANRWEATRAFLRHDPCPRDGGG